MTSRRLAVIDVEYLEKLVDLNMEHNSLVAIPNEWIGPGPSPNGERYWLQISLYGRPDSLLPGSNNENTVILHWEVVGLIELGDELLYEMNFLMPLVEAKGETTVLFPAKSIHRILKTFADKDPTIVDKLNDCIGLDRIKVLPIGDGTFGIALIVPD